jgi:hypothetical protein
MALTIFGYLDAGSGSLLLQLLLGGFAAIGVAAKLYWRRFLIFLRIRSEEDYAPQPQSESSPPE